MKLFVSNLCTEEDMQSELCDPCNHLDAHASPQLSAVSVEGTGEWVEAQKISLVELLDCEFEDDTVENITWIDSGWTFPEFGRPNRVLTACDFGTVIGMVVLQQLETT